MPATAVFAAPTTDPRDAERAYRPIGAARRLMLCRDEEVVLEGPAGTGKSRGCLEKVHLCALKYKGMRAAFVRKTRASMTESVLVTFEDHVLLAGDLIAEGPRREYRRSYHYPNGSEIVVAGIDRPSRLMSTEFDLIYVAEATELWENDWEMLTTRLRNGVMPYQQILGDCNPDAPMHWLHQRCDAARATVHFSRHEDNPRLFDPDRKAWTERGRTYIARLDRLTGVRRDRLRFGRRANVEGAVFPFDRAVHLIDRFDIPDDWTRFRAIDFGTTNPFVCQWWAADPDGRLYLYREIYMTRRTVNAHAPKILELSEGEAIQDSVADHDAGDRLILAEHGIGTVPAIKDVSVGVQAVQDRLALAVDDRPRLFVMRDALVEVDADLLEAKRPTCTEQEFDVYLYPKSKDGQPVKEAPVKVNDHGMDAMRYMVLWYDRNFGGSGPIAMAPWEA